MRVRSMHTDFSKLFHQFSQDHQRGHQPISANPDEWPAEWRTTYYKSYPRFQKISLATFSLEQVDSGKKSDLFDVISARKSQRDFHRGPTSLDKLATVLQYSCGNTSPLEKGRHRRAQPSGGGRFPIEVYPVVFRDQENLRAGLYHYNVKDNALDVLWGREFDDAAIDELFSYSWVKNASMALVMTAIFHRTQAKYGERGYRYILLEAGHIGQNIYLTTGALGLKCCALAGTRDEALEKLLDIDGVTESVVYAVAVGI